MDVAPQDLIALLGVAVAVVALLLLEPRLKIPYPILLVLGGLALSLVPVVPEFELPPDLVLLAFLPPLVYAGAFGMPIQELRASVASVSMLAVGLVLASAVAVAAVAHEIAGLPWAAAFVLGAVVAPTDPIAAAEVARRLRVPSRLIAVIEGESLLNDASALVVYRFAVAAVLTGTFTLWKAGLTFLWTAAGGIAIGLLVAWLVRQLLRRIDNPPTEIIVSLLAPYCAYLPAEAANVSAVLATVAAGIFIAWHAHEFTGAHTRLERTAVWETLVFVLNAVLFALIGLQLPQVLDDTAGTPLRELVKDSATVFGVLLGVRFLWVFVSERVPKLRIGRSWREPLILSWAGMRGAVSLAAALAIPFATDASDSFPGRGVIIFTAFAVILGTLVLQGLSFPLVIRFTGLRDEGLDLREEASAVLQAVEAALVRLDELVQDGKVSAPVAERMRVMLTLRQEQSVRLLAASSGTVDEGVSEFLRVYRELLSVERRTLAALHRSGEISDEVMQRAMRDVDLLEARIPVAG